MLQALKMHSESKLEYLHRQVHPTREVSFHLDEREWTVHEGRRIATIHEDNSDAHPYPQKATLRKRGCVVTEWSMPFDFDGNMHPKHFERQSRTTRRVDFGEYPPRYKEWSVDESIEALDRHDERGSRVERKFWIAYPVVRVHTVNRLACTWNATRRQFVSSRGQGCRLG